MSADVIAKSFLIFERSKGHWEGFLSNRREQILILSSVRMRRRIQGTIASQPHFSPWEDWTPADPGNLFPNVKDRKVNESSQNGCMKEKSHFSELITLFNEVTSLVVNREKWVVFILTSVRLLTLFSMTSSWKRWQLCVEKWAVRCIQYCLNGQAQILRDAVNGTEAIWKKLPRGSVVEPLLLNTFIKVLDSGAGFTLSEFSDYVSCAELADTHTWWLVVVWKSMDRGSSWSKGKVWIFWNTSCIYSYREGSESPVEGDCEPPMHPHKEWGVKSLWVVLERVLLARPGEFSFVLYAALVRPHV